MDINVWDRYLSTHWDRDKTAAIFQTTFSIVFSWNGGYFADAYMRHSALMG